MRNLAGLAGVVLLTVLAGSASAEYLALRSDNAGQRPEFTMLEHSSKGDRFEMRLPGVELTDAFLDGKRWDRVEIYGGGFEQELGKPEVPHITRLLAIPATCGVRVQARILEEKVIPDIFLMPAQGVAPTEDSKAVRSAYRDSDAYESDQFYPDILVTSGEPAIMRDVRVIPVQINPIRYNPVTHELAIAQRMEVQVSYVGTDLRNASSRPIRAISPTWGQLMRASVINFDDVIDTDEGLMGSYLVICEADANLVGVIEAKFGDWKRRIGHEVVLQTFTPGASNSTIKSMIQTAYDTWEVPPEFVLLVGDDNGNYVLPGWNYYVGDHPYSQLAGNDLLSDVAVGRIPAEDMPQAITMLNKVLWYEKQPYTEHYSWFQKGLMVAGSSSSGISTIQTKRWIKTRLLENGYTQIDTMWYNMGGSIVTTIANSLNGGVTYFNYRGYLGMSGWSNWNTDQLTNGFMLPFITTLTCGTGGFQGDSIMEHFVIVGTPSMGQGAVACVGTATSGTNTRCNNVVDVGMYQGIFNEGITQAGNALVRGKLELYNAYAVNNPSYVDNFSNWNNLAGDPGLELWTGPIQYMQASVPDSLNFGENQLSVLVTDTLGNPIEGASVCAYEENEVMTAALSEADGLAYLVVNPQTVGNLKVTVTKHNYVPVLDSLNLVQQDVAVGIYSSAIDDDDFGESQGDGDGTINPGETVEIPIILKNYGSSITASNVTLQAAVSDSFISPGDMFEMYSPIPPGSTSPSLDDVDFHVGLDAPNGHTVHFDLAISADQGSWSVALELLVSAPSMQAQNFVTAGGDSLLSPGETAEVMTYVMNGGDHVANGVTATLRSLDPLVTVVDSLGSYGVIQASALALNTADRFELAASENAPPGWIALLRMEFATIEGIVQADTFAIILGQKTSTDPQGPDRYGYYCYDDTDVNYPLHPTYAWVEIDPDYGGSGYELAIYDSGEDQDASLNVGLPFTFRYYGMDVDTITVCSNGWISTVPNPAFTLFRNWPIPSCMGPDGMVAPFWDDLTTQGSGRVYAWHDEINHLAVIEWSRMQNFGYPNPQETFEVILYDPEYYPTPTGDGEILFQYMSITEVSGQYWDNQYSTVGIETPDQLDGIEIVYSMMYDDPAAATLQSGRAYFFTTRFEYTPPGSELQITLTPISPPIIIPPAGGDFDFTVELENTGTSPASADVWCNVLMPDGILYGPVMGPDGVTLDAGSITERIRTQTVPGTAPAGSYEYRGYIGLYPSAVFDSSSFDFSKSGVDPSAGIYDEWKNSGEPWGEVLAYSRAEIPTEFSVIPPHPNPFNPTTALRFSLPEAARVNLVVYDISGRLVVTLVDGWRDAGVYEVTFDGSSWSSGVYLYRMQAGAFTASGKMVLVK